MAEATATAPITKKSNSKRYMVLVVVGIICAVVLKLGFFLVLFGMLPAIVAYETDHTKFKFVFSTVAAFNFAGVFPDMMQVFIAGGSIDILRSKLLDPYVWLIMYGSAGLGWSLVWLSPFIAATTLEGIYSGRIVHLEGVQKRSEEEWGPEVKGIYNRQPEKE